MSKCTNQDHKKETNWFKTRNKNGYTWKECKTCTSISRKKWIKEMKIKDPLYSRKAHLKDRYNITQEQFDTIFISQGKRCDICLSESSKGKGFVVDHCHNTKLVRGILCDACNKGLGSFNDNKLSLSRAIDYLNKWSKVADK